MIYVLDTKIKIQGYQKLLKVNEDEIVFTMFKKTIFIHGSNLSIEYFEKDEFSIKGNILSLEFE